jgi:hypothetical protein
MTRRLALQGASEDDAALLRGLLEQAASSLNSAWRLHADADADLLIIDIDTVYGHMDWLRAQSMARPVIMFTEHPQASESGPVLHKPLTVGNLIEVLDSISANVPDRPELAPIPEPAAVAPIAKRAPAAKTATTPAPPAPEPTPMPAPEPPRERRLSDWLAGGALSAPVSLRDFGAPELVLDPGARTFHADGSLRSLAGYCTRTITPDDWQPLDTAGLAKIQAAGKTQPYARLLWLCHALGSNGHPAPGMDINAKYKLSRWPQIEREFPKHFRIATVMMKQPATLTEVAEQSGATLPDVIDFTNAYNAIGYIETEGTATAEAPTRDTGRGAILARLRNPFGGG